MRANWAVLSESCCLAVLLTMPFLNNNSCFGKASWLRPHLFLLGRESGPSYQVGGLDVQTTNVSRFAHVIRALVDVVLCFYF